MHGAHQKLSASKSCHKQEVYPCATLQEEAYLTEAEDYYKDFVVGSSSAVPVNNWNNQMYAASLLLWQLTGNETYRNDLEVGTNSLPLSLFTPCFQPDLQAMMLPMHA